jgi:hypothetical protein
LQGLGEEGGRQDLGGRRLAGRVLEEEGGMQGLGGRGREEGFGRKRVHRDSTLLEKT